MKKIVLIVIGVVLIFAALRSAYYTYKRQNNYELNDWKTVTAKCIQENSYKKGTNNIRYYQRTYLYIVSGQEYTLNTVEAESKPYKTIKYNPSNPYDAETYEGLNAENIVVFFIGIICVFNSFILKFINTKKINEIKYKISKISKRNSIKIITGCFWGYLGLSLLLVLKNIFLTPNWLQIVTQYSKLKIVIELSTYIFARCDFKELASYFNVLWI